MSESERAGRYSDLFGTGEDARHGDEGHPSNCDYCPICAAIGVVRNTKPEVLEHLAGAARELILAAGLLLEEAERVAGGAERRGRAAPDERVRRIDLE
ncbi:MAG: hypothetical protein ACRDJV_09435 [Actinomycetota bacterium]